MNMIFIIGIIYVAAVVSVILILNLIKVIRQNKYKKIIDKIEIEKNVIDSTPVMAEISKIKAFLKNDKLDEELDQWEVRFQDIKNNQIPLITDMLLETEYSLNQNDYKALTYKIVKLEMELYRVKINADILLDEIKEITASEEKNRSIVTKFKTIYRDLYEIYSKNKEEYGEIKEPIALQFENIAKRFELFEGFMGNNDYKEVTLVIKSIDEMLKHMGIVLEEIPSIILLGAIMLPKKIKEIEKMYNNMKRAGYPLDYLNVDYNIKEANEKIEDILTRAKILNLEDSLLELKVLLDYFDALFLDFDKETKGRKAYEEANFIFKKKIDRINLVINDIFRQIENIKSEYDLSKSDINLLKEIKKEIDILNKDYEILITHTGNNTFAFSKLIKEIENLTTRLSFIEEKMDSSLSVLDTMKEDELRAREQLDEIKNILRDAKFKMREFNFPAIPKYYQVELSEASAAIKEIIVELDKKPIMISVLNTRVDTARDLTLKLFSRTNELLKVAKCSEFAIIYGNRYRFNNEFDLVLKKAEEKFFEGDFLKSLELTVDSINKYEPDFYSRLLKGYGKGV